MSTPDAKEHGYQSERGALPRPPTPPWEGHYVRARPGLERSRQRPSPEFRWVHSPEKVGRDAGELAVGTAIGVSATNYADALIAMQPDCVVYAVSGPQRDAEAVADQILEHSAP